MTTITIRITEVAGEPVLDSAAISLLFGVEDAAVCALPIANGAMSIPHEWLKSGRRRARGAMAHTGRGDMLDVLTYWARRDHDADIEVVYQGARQVDSP